jgi:fatty-acid desaturase
MDASAASLRGTGRSISTFSIRQAVLIASIHMLAFVALFVPSKAGVVALVVTYLISGYGISLGYHRGLSHGAFRSRYVVWAALSAMGALAVQGGPITWVSFHRAHHRFQDGSGDPHAASRGFLWSHMGWALHKGPNGYRRQRLRHLTAALARRPFLLWLERWHFVINIGLFGATALVAGVPFALWAFPLRVVILWHVTWLTNSVAHGAHRHDVGPRNVRWLSIIGFGEGLHANHHAAPSAPCFARARGEHDPGYWMLKLLARARLVHLASSNASRDEVS